jgi:hypothetical protein
MGPMLQSGSKRKKKNYMMSYTVRYSCPSNGVISEETFLSTKLHRVISANLQGVIPELLQETVCATHITAS